MHERKSALYKLYDNLNELLAWPFRSAVAKANTDIKPLVRQYQKHGEPSRNPFNVASPEAAR